MVTKKEKNAKKKYQKKGQKKKCQKKKGNKKRIKAIKKDSLGKKKDSRGS